MLKFFWLAWHHHWVWCFFFLYINSESLKIMCKLLLLKICAILLKFNMVICSFCQILKRLKKSLCTEVMFDIISKDHKMVCESVVTVVHDSREFQLGFQNYLCHMENLNFKKMLVSAMKTPQIYPFIFKLDKKFLYCSNKNLAMICHFLGYGFIYAKLLSLFIH